MKNILIVTSYTIGFPVLVAQEILKNSGLNICGVVISQNKIKNKRKLLLKKVKKAFKIGPVGTLNGFRMRKWYQGHQHFLPENLPLLDFCTTHKIPVLEIGNTATPEKNALEKIKNLSPDLGLSLGNSYISSKLFSLPKKGMLNVHHELLPEYPGGQSVIWPLYHKKQHTGYTIHEITKKIDAGKIIAKEAFPIKFRDTLAETVAFNYAHSKLLSAQKLPNVIQFYFNNKIEPLPNIYTNSYTTPNLTQFLQIRRNFRSLRLSSSNRSNV